MGDRSLSIVIPAYNEEECLPRLFESLADVIADQLAGTPVEVVVVDDHSTDRTPEILEEMVGRYPWLSQIRLLKNSGSHVAILAGLSVCNGSAAFIMGADLQDTPDIIPEFLSKLEGNVKIVFGDREARNDPLTKRILARLFNALMSRFVLREFPANGGDVFLIDRVIIDALLKCEEKNVNIFALMLYLCKETATVKYARNARAAGVSKWNYSKLVKLAYDSIITVGFLPIRAVLWGGVAVFLFSIVMIVYLVFVKLTGVIEVEGWTSLLAGIMALGGLNMISVSVLGEYIWRNFDQTRTRPMFIIQNGRFGSQTVRSQTADAGAAGGQSVGPSPIDTQ